MIGVAMAAAALGAAAQAVTGFGFSLVSAPVFVLLVGPTAAVRVVNLLALAVNIILVGREYRGAAPRQALALMVPAVAVTPLAAYAVHHSDPAVLSVVVGVIVVTCALALVSGLRAERIRGRPGMLAAGGISAVMNTTSGVGGPVVAMYALNAGWTPEMTRPTLGLFFIGLNVLSLSALGPVQMSLGLLAGLMVSLALGFTLGTVVARSLSSLVIGRAVLVLSIVGGIAAVIRGIVAS